MHCFCLLVPSLLSSVHHTPSSTSESVSILVNVDEQTNCDGVERLTITITLTGRDTIVSTQQVDFSDGIITFTSISAGDYTCSVTVEDEIGPVESMQIPCGGTDCVPLAIHSIKLTPKVIIYFFHRLHCPIFYCSSSVGCVSGCGLLCMFPHYWCAGYCSITQVQEGLPRRSKCSSPTPSCV